MLPKLRLSYRDRARWGLPMYSSVTFCFSWTFKVLTPHITKTCFSSEVAESADSGSITGENIAAPLALPLHLIFVQPTTATEHKTKIARGITLQYSIIAGLFAHNSGHRVSHFSHLRPRHCPRRPNTSPGIVCGCVLPLAQVGDPVPSAEAGQTGGEDGQLGGQDRRLQIWDRTHGERFGCRQN